jgi:hypothetical protein
MVYLAFLPLLPLMHTPWLPVVDWTEAPANLNGLIHFAERQNPVSVHVPSHFNWPLPPYGSLSNLQMHLQIYFYKLNTNDSQICSTSLQLCSYARVLPAEGHFQSPQTTYATHASMVCLVVSLVFHSKITLHVKVWSGVNESHNTLSMLLRCQLFQFWGNKNNT